MENETPVAKTAETSTTSAAVPATTAQTEQVGTTKSPTLREVAKQAFDTSTKEVDKAAEGGVPEEDKTGEAKETAKPEEGQEEKVDEGKEKEDVAKVEEAKTDEPDLPPFHQHPRWQEKVKEVNDLKAKTTEIETKLAQYEPQAKNWKMVEDYRVQNNISQQQFNEAMTFVAALNADPKAARAMLAPVWESLSSFDENSIPADLQARVTEGEISETAAKEIAGYRAKQAQSGATGQFAQRQQAQTAQTALNQSVQSWDTSKRGSDPDFKPKVGTSPDGLYELTAQKFAYLASTNPPQSQADVIKNLETAYTDSKALFRRTVAPKAPTPKSPTSSTASTAKAAPPKSIREVVAKVAADHGISMASTA